MKTFKTFYKENRDEIDSIVFILCLACVISFVCVYFLFLAIKNKNMTDIVGMSALLVTWGCSLFFIAAIEIRGMIKDWKDSNKVR